jgi:hypothetical protein
VEYYFAIYFADYKCLNFTILVNSFPRTYMAFSLYVNWPDYKRKSIILSLVTGMEGGTKIGEYDEKDFSYKPFWNPDC